ncbi:DNA topoisomerase 2-alpha [Tyrophagus putrescentiae]|nr:DNA topoisomerase 2-alpha [Tyrophagus putrescentiae]
MANVKIKNPDAVIFDYNTIVSNAFVENQLMPYFETAHEAYFDANWSKEECQADLKALAAAAAEDAAAPKVDLTAPKQAQIDAVNKYVEYCGTADKENSKAFILYRIITFSNLLTNSFHVWFDGYKRGKITTPVYSDVAVHIQNWAEASRKFLQKTSNGDLNALIVKQFDTTLGQLTSPATYQNLIAKTKDQPANTVFLTMGIDEAKAAKAAGLQVVLVLTHSEEVDAITDTVSDIPIARSFTQIEFVVSQDLRKHLVVTEGNSAINSQDDDLFEKAYSNQQITERKCWLQAEMLKLNSATDESKSVYSNATIHLSFKDFVRNDLVQAFISVIERCIPSIIFGVKPIHQKIIEFGRSLSEGDQLRVCDYAGEMATRSGYQHSLAILGKIITRIGRNTNGNLSILETIGCFGSQGIDSASDRYISTKVTSLGRLLFNNNLPPILPVFMLNGVKGCAYGFKVQIPCYAVDDLINKTRQKLRGEQISSFTPSYQHHSGKLVKLSAKGDFISFGVIEQINNNTILIKLLPLEKTAEKYKEKVLIPMLTSSKITSFKPAKRNSGFFILTLNEKSLQDAKQNGILTSFQLQTKFSASLSLIDSKGNIKEYGDTETMFNDWFEATLEVFCKHFDNSANAKQEWQDEEIAIIEHVRHEHQHQNHTAAQLITRAEELVKKAKAEVAAHPHSRDTRQLEHEVAVVERLVKALQATPAPTGEQLRHEEQALARAEQALNGLIERLHHQEPHHNGGGH